MQFSFGGDTTRIGRWKELNADLFKKSFNIVKDLRAEWRFTFQHDEDLMSIHRYTECFWYKRIFYCKPIQSPEPNLGVEKDLNMDVYRCSPPTLTQSSLVKGRNCLEKSKPDKTINQPAILHANCCHTLFVEGFLELPVLPI